MPTTRYQRFLSIPAEVKASSDSSVRRIVGTGTSSCLDRQGEHIHPSAVERAMDAFMKNPVMGYAHDTRMPIGKWTGWRRVKDSIVLEGELLEPGDDLADAVWRRIEQGVIRGMSVGFNPVGSWSDSGEEDKEGNFWWGGTKGDRDIEILEWSIVPIPANSDAQDLRIAKAIGADTSQPWLNRADTTTSHKSWGDLSAEDINRQIDAQLNSPGKIRYWVVELFETYCILSDDNDGKHYRIAFALVDGNVVLGERVEVTQEWVEVRLSYDGVLTQEEREELRFSDDLTAAGKRLEAARNICRHWVKGGRALSPESLDAVLSPMSMIPEILRAGRVLSDKNRTAVLAALEALTEVVQRDDESRASSNKPAAEDTVDDDTTKGITQERDSAPDTAASILDAPWKTERRQRSLLDLPA